VTQLVKQTCFVAALLSFICLRAHAQMDLDQVHVTPQIQPSTPDVAPPLKRGDVETIRTSVELVLVPVTVIDSENRIVTGLEQENFRVYEDKHPKPIKDFWKEDEPVSIGIVLDASGSMTDKFDRAQDAVKALLQESNPEDEFFLVTFANQPILVRDFTRSVDDIQSPLLFTRPKGRTSLLDAIVLAVNNMKGAHYRRRALVIISDGGDNRSLYTEKDVKSLVKESEILIYSIGVFDREVRTLEERLGPLLLTNISGWTGASSYTVENPSYLPKIAEHIAVELRNQYVLGYKPDSSRHDGKWRKIKVSLALPRGIPQLHVQARTGYYSTSQ
jgi:Ca-activated chloride channel homolog